jgi:UPF0271 protein
VIHIDLNSDLGESYGPWRMGDDAAMLDLVTSANIACGGHAGDPETMFETVRLAVARGVAIGAHPGYPDREGFGRRVIPCSTGEIERFVAAQTGALMGAAALAGGTVVYVKPHGALGNLAAENTDVAIAIARSVNAVSPDLALLAMAGSALEAEGQRMGLAVFSEIFADRGYQPNGRLVPRGKPGAMIEDAEEAAHRLVDFCRSGLMPTIDGSSIPFPAHSICVHGDSPGAVAMARIIRDALTTEGIAIAPFRQAS